MKYDGRFIQKFIKRTVNGIPNQRVGVIVATVENGKIKYGWSLAKVRATLKDLTRGVITGRGVGIDKFDKVIGLNIALSRLNAGIGGSLEMPATVRSQLRDRFVQVKEFVKDDVTGKTKTVRKVKIVRGFETRARKYFKV